MRGFRTITSHAPIPAPRGDYLDPFKAVWNLDGQQAREVLDGLGPIDQADLLLVDWRNEASREAAGILLEGVGITLEYPELPKGELIGIPCHTTKKNKQFYSLLLPSNTDRHIVERRYYLPDEASVVASFFRGYGHKRLRDDLTKAAEA